MISGDILVILDCIIILYIIYIILSVILLFILLVYFFDSRNTLISRLFVLLDYISL